MARRPRDARIETREARSRLKRAQEPYWREIMPGLGIGYLKGVRGGIWRVRVYQGGNPPYRKGRLGKADDHVEADGVEVLDYGQAVEAAIAWSKRARIEPTTKSSGTVKDAADEYVAELRAAGKKSVTEVERVIRRDILPEWASVSHPTKGRIVRWIGKLVDAPRRTRGGRPLPLDDSPEGKRKRRATAQKKWQVFRAILNVGAARGWFDPREWTGIGNLKDIDPPQDEFPTLAECKRLARRAPAEFRPIVEATFLTGAAYSELTAAKVRDYTPSTGHLRIFNSKRRPRHIPLTPDGIALFDELTAGKDADDYIFTHADGRPWKKSEQNRPMAEANAAAKLDPPITLTRLRKAYGSLLLNAGVPLEVVSRAMGHSSPEVTRRHYARLLQGTIDEQIRKALPSLGIKRGRKVARLS